MYGKKVMKDKYHAMSYKSCGKHTGSHENAHTSAAVQHGIAVDRFAREIVGILKASPSALAATECQSVGWHTIKEFAF
jgi:hypothetical protein